MVVVSISTRQAFDFEYEAALAAVNEVCSEKDPEAWRTCTIDELCPGCKALAASFKRRLIAAYAAGRQSTGVKDAEIVPDSETGSDIPGGGAS